MKTTGKTRVTGIFGCPVGHSFSPVMHNAAFRALDLDWVYVPFPVVPGDLQAAVRGAAAMGIAGLNITVPHKEAVIPFLDELSREAELLAAVNTIEVSDGRLIGHNTDGLGFIRALEREFSCTPREKTVGILGAGGAARGVGLSLALSGAGRIVFFNRTPERAKKLAEEVRRKTSVESDGFSLDAKNFRKNLPAVDILINSTIVGMRPEDAEILSPGQFPRDGLAADLIYNPPVTGFLRNAEKAGMRVVNGIGMLVYQGALSFEIWTGKKAPVENMREAVLNFLGG